MNTTNLYIFGWTLGGKGVGGNDRLALGRDLSIGYIAADARELRSLDIAIPCLCQACPS